MRVFKFGGASVRDAGSLQNTVSIIRQFSSSPLLVVVSAMGKTTNALESVFSLSRVGRDYKQQVESIANYHRSLIKAAFSNPQPTLDKLDQIISEFDRLLKHECSYDEGYDQLVSTGELMSSIILADLLSSNEEPCVWVDARQYILTDSTFREARVNWEITGHRIHELKHILETQLIVTQGFIGCDTLGRSTTLGREGSDFSAAIFASCLQADTVTIWKDVPGVMSADPKRLPNATVFPELPYKEAAEMTYYGASVIHPKTIKPLANRNIPLLVKNFDDPALPGTRIHDCTVDNLPPLIVFKEGQCLVSCKVVDYSFISEQQLSLIFHALSELDIKLNVMQNSAISFSFCIDFRESKVTALIERLRDNFEVFYNVGLTLITVKNYDESTYQEFRSRPYVLLEQSSRSTLQLLIQDRD